MRTKDNILIENGYEKNFHSDVYFNPNTKTIFSPQCIRDKSGEWLLDRINSINNTDGWIVYFCSPIPRSNQQNKQLIAQYRKDFSIDENIKIIDNE